MPASTSAAATSSWVDNGFDAQSATSAPPACSVSIRFAVSVVTCRHAPMRMSCERPFLLEPFLDQREHRHLGTRPSRCARGPPGRESHVPNVVRHRGSLLSHAREQVDEQPAHRRPRSRSRRGRPRRARRARRTRSSASRCRARACRAPWPAGLPAPSTCRRPSRPPPCSMRTSVGVSYAGPLMAAYTPIDDADAERLGALEREVAQRGVVDLGRADERRHAVGIPPAAQRGHTHHVEVIAQDHDRAGRFAGHETPNGCREHDRVDAELACEPRQQRRHIHAVPLVEVHATEERGDRDAREVPEHEPTGVTGHARGREPRQVREGETRGSPRAHRRGPGRGPSRARPPRAARDRWHRARSPPPGRGDRRPAPGVPSAVTAGRLVEERLETHDRVDRRGVDALRRDPRSSSCSRP